MICDENEENNLSQQIVESGVKSRKISIFKEFLRHDKNIICLPWQHPNKPSKKPAISMAFIAQMALTTPQLHHLWKSFDVTIPNYTF